MSPMKRYVNKPAKARQRRRLPAHRGLGPARKPGGGDRRPLRQPTKAAGQDHRSHVSHALWLSDALGTLSGAGLGQALALTPTRGAAQTLLAQAAAALGAGGLGADLAPCAGDEPGHPEPLAVDLGLG